MSSTTPSTSKIASAGGPSGAGRGPARASSSGRAAGGTAIARSAGQVDLAEVVLPVDLVDVEAEALAVVGVQPVEQLARVAVVEDAVELAVRPVDLVQPAQAVELALVLVQAQLDVVAARDREPVDEVAAAFEQRRLRGRARS